MIIYPENVNIKLFFVNCTKALFTKTLIMTDLQKFTLEFPLNISPRLLYTLISTAEGLSRWFADKVDRNENEFLFEWEGSFQTAKLVDCKESEFVRFEWIDDFQQISTMELKINDLAVSGGAVLVVTDFSEPIDMDFTQMWWTSQVGRLQRLFNS
jgi:hypothetical protein